ncbi:DNA-binding response regulator [Bartonella sp. HY329]|uniref:response regulator transcription factor n=1 Tax=unclassified Bartonella TaxID=2645622 RepID=UPI0021C7B6A1|nr:MULTISPECIES: DNA-binding response regulator [unclassified Bartonella]UXM95805.1 DNA-binding response regulator [Bartonella sp. HY329]UXN10130.1 DNA-binding response regulator [Bartonella sp. HY328]
MNNKTLERVIILVIDDSAEMQNLMQDALAPSKAMVLAALNGKDALEIVKRVTPDLIFMDAIMPHMDGFATTLKLKSDPSLAHVPIIFMTGLDDSDNMIKGLEAGAVDYITKPIKIDEMLARLHVHLKNARATQSARTALDFSGRFLFACNMLGKILWSTPQASQLLVNMEKDTLSQNWQQNQLVPFLQNKSPLGSSLDIAHEDQHLKLTYMAQSGNDEYLFRLNSVDESAAKRLQQRFELTARETEICEWLGHGKSNKDIADILGLSPRTVNKHLESIFSKLGVENRAAAAALLTRSIHQED